MMKRLLVLLPAAGLLVGLVGCTPDISPDTYSVGSVGSVQQVKYGRIISVRPVKVKGGGQTGTVVGAVAGGVAGSAIGGGSRANILGALGGAVVGGIVGQKVGEGVTSQTGLQYGIQLCDGRTIQVVQGAQSPLQRGQMVEVAVGQGADAQIHPAAPGVTCKSLAKYRRKAYRDY